MTVQTHRHIQFKDFNPDREEVEMLSETLSKIQKLLPSDTSVRSVFSHKGKDYSGNLVFRSKFGDFIAKADGRNMNQLLSKLKNKILKQWRARKTAIESRKMDTTLDVRVV